MSWNDPRPMSPHLQIYKLPLTALVSITNRASGVVNSVALLLLVWVIAKAAGGADAFDFTEALIGSWFARIVFFGFTFSLYFHMCNGIRHLFWDIGKGFEVETATKSAKASIAAAALLTIITWIVASAS